MRINTNINSMRTQEYMRQNQAKMSNAMDRLSSGKRINNASDDAAGLAIATRMRARESGLSVAADNTQNGMSLIRTADSAMNSVSNILLRMRDIANQSANGTNTDKNQVALQKEFAALKEQITYIADNTQFNDKNLLNGNQTINIQTLDSHDSTKQIGIDLKSATLDALGIKDLTVGAVGSTEAKNYVDAKEALAKNVAANEFIDAKKALDGNTIAKAYVEAKTAFDDATPAVQKLVSDYTDAVAALAKDNTNATLQQAVTDTKALMDANTVAKTYFEAKTAHDSANQATKDIVTKYDTKLGALDTAANKAIADFDKAKAAFDESPAAKELVKTMDDAKQAATQNSTANAYLVAKAAAEAAPTDAGKQADLENATKALEKDDTAKGLVKTYENAKEALNPANAMPLDAVKQIDAALKTVADNRATLGATLNRLDFNVNNLKSQSSAMAASASQIEDADMAKEMSEMTKFKILNEAGISMLSQANQTPQMVSKLLQ
ncbi:flagellin N-terminal helical domain-containing protein [Bacillus paranthracis]|uniref:flagellin N-terminal helical domain-containing protein n=1 Tax=Bacillus paranthracis TaxID=2026186 RepID=UPI0021CE669E|nr:flagellin [Bacillus paranthracis]MCU5470591.1 flagellin [Bacillus paranthracis]